MPSDITKYGIAGLRGLRGLNQQPTEEELALQEARRERNRVLTGGVGPSLEDTTSTHAYSEDSPMRDWGTSKYDEQFMNAPLTKEGVQDTRYENQPWYDTLANGLGKALGTAGTTFVSSLVGLPYGLIQAGVQGRWSALWDNDVTQALSDADDWLEENLTNYRSTQQQQNPWWSKDNLFSMNFIADDVIKNMGFTLGAAASMAVGSGSLGLLSKSLGIVNDVSKGSKMANAAAAALFSATGEGMIEARQGVEERNKLEQQKLNDALAPEYNELQAEQEAINQRYALTGDYQTYKAQLEDWSARKSTLDERKAAGEQQIEESGREMGNKILLGNQVLLTAGNMIQFGKAMTKSFDNARHAAEITSKSAKPFGVRAVKAGKDFADGYVLKGKGWGRLSAATKGLLTEGSEEMNQQFIQSAAGAAYTEEDVNDYWKAKLDPEAYRETTKGLYTLGNILDRGFNESWGDANQWEQFVIGGLTGMSGSYSPTKLFNQDKTKSRLDPRRYGSWEGGAIREVNDFNKAYNQYSENIDELNKVLAQEDFGSRTQNLIAHTYLEGNKEYAAANNDKKTWKDEDDKQAIHDIQAFLRAGKLDDLRAIYDEMGKDLSDEDIESIVKGTSTEKEIEGKKVMSGPFFDDKGNQIKSNDEIREEIKHNSEELNRKLDSYLDSIDYVNKRTGGQLTKDQEDNLAYLHNLSKEKDVRFQKIMSNVRKRLPNKFLIKTNSTPEQLKQQYTSSDLAFSKDDNTPKGYVEVDTSLMNDQNFGAFFADTILWGDNIQAGYTKEDLIEELEAREEDKKYSEEEQKKRKEERAKKQQERDAKKAEEAEADRKEQQDKNVYLIRQAFVDNAMQKEGKSLVQALNDDALEEIFSDINDALELRNEAAEFENTLREYMLNPQKVDKTKQKAEKANEEKAKKDAEDKATVKDMMEMSDDDLAAAVLGGRKGKNKNGKKAQKAMGMKNGRSKAEKSLEDAVASGKITREAADDALKLLDSQMGRMLQENDEEDYGDMKSVASVLFDTDTEAMNDEETLWDDDFRAAVVNGTVEVDDKIEASYQARLDAAKDAINFIAEDVESQLADYDQSIDMSKQFKDTETEDEKGTKELDEEIGKAADEKRKSENPTSTSSRNKSESSEPLPSTKTRITTASTSKSASKTQPQSVEEPEPVMPEKEETAGTDEALEEDKKSGEKGNNGAQRNKVWGLWHTGVSEVGQLTNEPWKADPSNPNAELQQKRYDAIRKKLIDSGAYTARKQGKIKPGMKIGFRIFQSVNDEAGDFVVFITDEHDNIIGDLPSEDARFNIERFPMSMEALYKALHDEWDDATDEERQAGMVSQYTTVIDDVFVGKVKYQEERQTVTSLTQGSEVKPLFAVKRIAKDGTGNMDTGVDEKGTPNVSGIHMPLTGRSGQPYVLIQVPGVHNGIGIKYLAVPIKTITVGEANTNNTIYIKVLKTLLDNIKQRKVSDFEARRLLEALLSVHSVHVNLDEGSDTKKELGIRITTHRSQSGITKGVPYTIYAGKREDMDVNAIITALSGIQVNVSSQLINGSGKTGEFGLAKFLTVNGNPVDYNEMLAEVSHTNAAEPMTVNDWFTIKPLQEKNNKLEVVENSVQMPAWDTVDVDNQTVYPNTDPGKKWTVKVSEGYTVYDEEGNPITTKTHGKEKAKEAAILAAEIFGKINNKPNNRPYAVLINSKSYIYDPVKRTFKTYKAAEKDPAYVYGKAAEGKKLTEQEKYTIMKDALERQMIELEEMYEERRRQQGIITPQQIGQDMVTHLKEMGVDVELVDDANKAAEGIEDAQLSVEELSEIKQIKKDAIANGTFMKAPNGKPTNLTERQWLQVRTKNFINWFGDWINDPNNASKVVDENGEPLVVYHHTDNPNLTRFSTDFENYFAKDGGTKEAIFFDEEKTGTLNRKYDLPVFLNIRELNEYNETKQQLHDRGTTYREIVNNSAKKNNKTGGVHMKDFDDNKKEHQSIWIIHNPNQVKSATDNNGEFSTENPDINMLKVDGKILGFEHNGKLYLQKDALNPNLPMHEYTHLWDKVIKRVDPRLWNRGKELMKTEAADLWKQIAEDENYGKRWEKEGKTVEEIEDLIASEVHSRLTGENFEEYANKNKGTFAQLKQWLLDVFKALAQTLGMSDEAVKNLTLSDWKNMTVRDFMEKSITLNTIQEAQEKNNKDHTEEVNRVLEQMEEERKHFKLVKWDSKQKKYVEDKEGDYYRDDRDGSIHARVSNVNDADVDVIEANEKAGFRGKSPAFVPAVGSGNAVDTFVRRFYEEAVGLFEGINWNDKEEAEAAMELAEAVNEQIGVPNISKEDAKNLIIHLAKIKQQMGQDWEINSSGIVASGLVSFDGETIIKVAGTIDLLAYNKKTGQYVIIDMKSHLSPLFRKDGKLKTDAKTQAKIAHWRAQQTLYKQFLEAKYGIKISGLRIMPFGVNYSTDFKNADYEVGDDGVLRDKGIVVDINPKYDGKLLGLTPKANTKYDVGQLPESIKRLLPRKGTAVVKQPEDEEIAVKGKLIDIRDSIPEGMKLSAFISEKYKKDATVMKLVEILESNKGTSSPIMMTQGSQNLLMDAIDQDALNKAIQETKAAKENLKIEIPAQEEQSIDDIIDGLESQNVDSDAIDFIKDLPEDIQRKLSNGDALNLFLTMYNDGAEDAEIIQALQNIDLDIRNKKAVKEYTMIDLPKELKWMRENLPQLSSERRLHIVQGLIRCSDGTESFGQVNAAMILIGTQAAEGTVYHEAFHAVVQFLLTDDEINKLFDAAKKRWGDLPAASLEERMADEFENYMKGLDPEDSRIKRFFKELWKAIQAWLNRTGYIESLYRDINSGVYAGRDVRDDRSNALSRIRSEQRDHTKDYDFLTTDEQERLRDADISKNQWNQLTKEQQEYMLHCVV